MHDQDHGKRTYNTLHFNPKAKLDPSQITDKRRFPGMATVAGLRPPLAPYAPPRPSQVRTKRPKNG